ncbi:MAG: methylated-DNA--[protein]-cysteine S-methyltransferase [Planctomycetota bacterium]|jgi:methylated-DNA-[protein]-cysteine S-methyltransferase
MITATSVSSCRVKTPIGVLGMSAGEKGIFRVSWTAERSDSKRISHPVLRRAAQSLERYFAGEGELLDIPLDHSDLPVFHRDVLKTLREEVRYGESVSYGVLAVMAGRPGAARAVGNAMNRNPTPLFVPCHRVLAANGIGGFGPGTDLKRRLLAHEGIQA